MRDDCHHSMKKYFLSLLLVAVTANAEDTRESSTDVCKQCNCATDTAQILTLDCQKKDLEHMLTAWPGEENVTTIRATFTGNVMTTLEPFPPTEAVVEVVLSKCNISYLISGLFCDVKNLKFLDLSYNQLTADQISSDKFKGPYNSNVFEPVALEDLNLAYNRIHSIGKNVFEHLPNLTRLNLEGNDFCVLDIHTQLALTSIKNLRSLNLAANELTELVKNAINDLNLTEINLSNNLLDFVPGSLAHVGKSLEILVLDNNPIIEFIADTFLGLENLNELSVNNLTKLKYVNANTFVPMAKLKKLRFSHNFLLKDIDREAFGINQTLEELYLNNNNLYRIDYKLLPWSKLRIFEFKENPLDCSCDLYNISTALSRDITKNEDSPYCMDPRNERSVQVFYLKSDICTFKSKFEKQREFIKYHFSLMRMALVVLSVLLMLVAFVAVVLGYFKYRRYQRNRNYPYASQVFYNPLSTNNSRF